MEPGRVGVAKAQEEMGKLFLKCAMADKMFYSTCVGNISEQHNG